MGRHNEKMPSSVIQAPRGPSASSQWEHSSIPATAKVGLYPIVTFQYSSTTLYQFSYHIRSLFFETDNRISPYAKGLFNLTGFLTERDASGPGLVALA
jgi:hypothetical protein